MLYIHLVSQCFATGNANECVINVYVHISVQFYFFQETDSIVWFLFFPRLVKGGVLKSTKILQWGIMMEISIKYVLKWWETRLTGLPPIETDWVLVTGSFLPPVGLLFKAPLMVGSVFSLVFSHTVISYGKELYQSFKWLILTRILIFYCWGLVIAIHCLSDVLVWILAGSGVNFLITLSGRLFY